MLIKRLAEKNLLAKYGREIFAVSLVYEVLPRMS